MSGALPTCGLKTLPAQLGGYRKIGHIAFTGGTRLNGTGATTVRLQYSDEELSRFIPFMETICHTAQVVQVYFNNHAKGQAVVNARKMKILAQNIFSGR